jgi:hypothetical protein
MLTPINLPDYGDFDILTLPKLKIEEVEQIFVETAQFAIDLLDKSRGTKADHKRIRLVSNILDKITKAYRSKTIILDKEPRRKK